MALTSYCKKCGRDVPVGDRCPNCGGRLAANTVRLAWCVDHAPVKDWMSWNAVLRLVMPVLGMTMLLTIVLEALFGGLDAVQRLLTGGFTVGLLGALLLMLAVLLLVLILQGDDLLDCVVDSRGIHVQQYLPNPTAFRLLLRLRSLRLLETLDEDNVLLISQKEILWKDIRRVQLWPEKTMILLYAPVWWMRLSLPCTPFTYEDAMGLIRDKIGKKKNVVLPPELVVTAPPKAKSSAPRRTQQLSFEDVPPREEWLEDPVPEVFQPEQPEDFMPLQDVLDEIRQSEESN